MFCFIISWKWRKPNYGLLKLNSSQSNTVSCSLCVLRARISRSEVLEQYLIQQQQHVTQLPILQGHVLDEFCDELVHRFGVEWNSILQKHQQENRKMNTFKMSRRALFLAICHTLGLRRDLYIKYFVWDLCVHYYHNIKSRHSYKRVVTWLLPQMSTLKVPVNKVSDVLTMLCCSMMLTCHLTFMILALLNFPQWQGRIKDNKEDALLFIHEVQRYYPVVMYIPYPSDKIICDYYATNHDPKRFRFPDNFYPIQLNDSEYSISRPSRFPNVQVIDDIMFVALEYLLDYSFVHGEHVKKLGHEFKMNGNMALPYSNIPLILT